MVSIVIVSHSAKLAEGVLELASQMVQGQVALAAAGGIDDPENPIGTDATKVYEAIEAVYSPDGVLVMMDLGSALLSAETALEFLTPDQQAHVKLCAAPLVEGTMAAAVQASIGASLEQVLAEALGALAVKTSQLEAYDPGSTPAPEAPVVAAGSELHLTVRNPMGLHARPAANFVKAASRFQAEIWVRKGEKQANAKSINQVATLGVRQGQEIVVSATGADAVAALAAIKALAADNFGEPDSAVVKPLTSLVAPPPAIEGELVGIPASPGVAIGPVFQYRPRLPQVVSYQVEDSAEEWARLQAAIATAHQSIHQLQADASATVGANEAAIFGVHQMFLQDPALQDDAQARIYQHKLNAEAAWQQAIEAMAGQYEALDDDYLRARVADVRDVGQRVLRQLLGVTQPELDFSQPVILLARDLTPSDTARLDPANVLGICTQSGGATSHSAILARALGIPAVVGLNGAMEQIVDGQTIALDGDTGRLWPQPTPAQLANLTAKREAWQQQQQESKFAGRQPAVTRDGLAIEVVANIGGARDAAAALDYGAEGVGLFRTEFLFFDRDSAPTEEEQAVAYRQVGAAMGSRPVVIRTLDVGGDKPLPYLKTEAEDNPFLGWRGIRFCLDQPELFKTQLRAILRASAGHNFKIMFPMIGTLAELRAAKNVLAEVQAELRAAAIEFDEDIEVGIMIEVPSAVAVADRLAAEADFFSIGSNDLTQYVMAADRGNGKVAGLVNALQPAVLAMIRQTAEAAHAAGIWVGMCGEMAGNALATPVLIGLGLDELSMSAASIPAVKAVIRKLSQEQARQIVTTVFGLDSAAEIREYLASIKL